MAEYINREDVREMMRMEFDDEYADEAVDRLPAAKVEPVRHGRWIQLDAHKGMEQFKCSVCRSECYVPTCMGSPMYGYCPNCGAQMDLGGADNEK